MECLRCNECKQTIVKLEENINLKRNSDMFSCITEHPGFQSVCLDPLVLQVSQLHAYK